MRERCRRLSIRPRPLRPPPTPPVHRISVSPCIYVYNIHICGIVCMYVFPKADQSNTCRASCNESGHIQYGFSPRSTRSYPEEMIRPLSGSTLCFFTAFVLCKLGHPFSEWQMLWKKSTKSAKIDTASCRCEIIKVVWGCIINMPWRFYIHI